MNKTSIEYIDFSWNPIAMRCTPVSEGCANCWHLRMADRLAGNSAFPDEVRRAYAGDEPPVLIGKRLEEPLRRRKPAVVGVQFMGDLFHSDVPFQYTHRVFDVMQQASQHTFLVLTKRPKRMYEFLDIYRDWPGRNLPYSNVWGLVTAENQKAADERIPWLLKCPFAVRGVSCEPLLKPNDLHRWLTCWVCGGTGDGIGETDCPACGGTGYDTSLDWVICGGESGPGARPMYPAWPRWLRDQAQAAGIPYFFKQHGAWLHESQFLQLNAIFHSRVSFREKSYPMYSWPDGTKSYRVGKHRAGRLLDGRTWDEFPNQ